MIIPVFWSKVEYNIVLFYQFSLIKNNGLKGSVEKALNRSNEDVWNNNKQRPYLELAFHVFF